MAGTTAFIRMMAGAEGSRRARLAARRDPPGRRSALLLTAVATSLAGLIAMGEIDRLVSGALGVDLESRSISEVTGPTALGSTDVWHHWARNIRGEAAGSVDNWIAWHAGFDVLFFLGYGLLLYRLVRGRSRVALIALGLLLATEALETVLLWFAAGALAPVDGEVAAAHRWILAGVTTAKWGFVLLVVVAALRHPAVRGRLAEIVVRGFRAARVQRLSLFIAVVLAALSLTPAANFFDQFPDVVRGWFDAYSPQAVLHLLWGVLAYLVAAVALFVLGRQRSERSWTAHVGPPGRGPTPPTAPPQYALWLVGPAAAGAAALWLWSRDRPELVDRVVLGVFVSVPLVLLLLSFLVKVAYALGRLFGRRSLWAEAGNPQRQERARDVWSVGDLLAMSMVAIGALSVVRALIAPVILGTDRIQVHAITRIVTLVVALVAACLGPWLLGKGFRALDRRGIPPGSSGWRAFLRPSSPEPQQALLRRPLALAVWGAALLLQLVVMLWPVQIAGFLGVVAMAVLALVAWAVILGFLIVHFQHHQPLEIFRLLHLRANPVMTLLVIAPLVAGFWGGVDGLHDVRTRTDQQVALPQRMPMEEAFTEWLGEPAACEVPVGELRVRPMLLVAASGGGIRAATWTAGVLGLLDEDECSRAATFLSSGVSGGSVGLVLARGDHPLTDVRDLARPSALSAAIAGTLVGDLVAGSTGLRIPSDTTGGEQWRDRAALMETIWEQDATVLGKRYDTDLRTPGGFLVLNSTDTGSGCRVLVSQLDLDGDDDERGAGPAAPESPCGGPEGDLAASFDLRDAYGSCTPDMTWATAAMLSARFPTVTPAGRLPVVPPADEEECAGLRQLQLVDGGYAESSGLGTLADIAPDVLQPVLSYNADRGPTDPVVVPIVLYLEDEPRSEIARDAEGLVPELFVPLVGQDAGTVQVTSATWLQRAAAGYGDPCPEEGDQACTDAVRAVHDALTGGVVVAAPVTRPGVEAPLGWTLSDESRTRLTRDVTEQGDGCTAGGGPYACTAELLDFLVPGR